MDPMKLDLAQYECIAEASSAGDGRDRWTELRVFHNPRYPRRWVAQAMGCSRRLGERTKERRLSSASLERVLSLFDETDLGVIVREGAREWAEAHGISARVITGQHVPAEDRAALAWLYGIDPADVAVKTVARDLGAEESTIRAALKDQRAVRIPLGALLPYVDREAFQNAIARKREADRG